MLVFQILFLLRRPGKVVDGSVIGFRRAGGACVGVECVFYMSAIECFEFLENIVEIIFYMKRINCTNMRVNKLYDS